jgi:hypothetical protein
MTDSLTASVAGRKQDAIDPSCYNNGFFIFVFVRLSYRDAVASFLDGTPLGYLGYPSRALDLCCGPGE